MATLSEIHWLWIKRLILLLIFGLLFMALSGKTDLSHPFVEITRVCRNASTDQQVATHFCDTSVGFSRFIYQTTKYYEVNEEEIIMLVLLISGGGLLWHLLDEKKK